VRIADHWLQHGQLTRANLANPVRRLRKMNRPTTVYNMWIVVVLFELTTAEYSDQVACFDKYNCACGRNAATLNIDCANGVWKDENFNDLISNLNQLIASSDDDDRLQSLTISNIPLLVVPPSLCHLTELRSFVLRNTLIARLPDNCFDNMTKLTQLSAQQPTDWNSKRNFRQAWCTRVARTER